MKTLVIAGTVIANKETAKNVVKRLNNSLDTLSYESVLAVDMIIEKIVNTGFLTWEETEILF